MKKKKSQCGFAVTFRIQKDQPECLINHPPHFISSCRLCSISNHQRKGGERTVKHSERDRPNQHQCIEFELLYFNINRSYYPCNQKIKLYSKYVCRKNHSVFLGPIIISHFRYGVLEVCPECKTHQSQPKFHCEYMSESLSILNSLPFPFKVETQSNL